MGRGGTARGGRGFTCQVIRDHEASFPEPLAFPAGEELAVEDRVTAWEGWVWCVNREGTGGWVPESFVVRHGDTRTAPRGYDLSELSVRAGDALEFRGEAAGWLCCADREGRMGWVPAACVKAEEAPFFDITWPFG